MRNYLCYSIHSIYCTQSFSEETTTSGLSKSEDEAEPEDEEAELEGDLAAQALEVAQRTGDAFQILFWQVASFYLNFYAAEKQVMNDHRKTMSYQ